MAAIDSVFRLLRPGDHAIISEAVYGGVIRLTTQSSCNGGWSSALWRPHRSRQVERAIKPNTKMIYIETPTNPTMRVTDIAAVAKISAAQGATLVADNTFLSRTCNLRSRSERRSSSTR